MGASLTPLSNILSSSLKPIIFLSCLIFLCKVEKIALSRKVALITALVLYILVILFIICFPPLKVSSMRMGVLSFIQYYILGAYNSVCHIVSGQSILLEWMNKYCYVLCVCVHMQTHAGRLPLICSKTHEGPLHTDSELGFRWWVSGWKGAWESSTLTKLSMWVWCAIVGGFNCIFRSAFVNAGGIALL